ncbi:MAG: BtpA/SgcQ family protein [Chloroflexota bacterium]
MSKPAWKERMDALQITDLKGIFRTAKPIIGMVHCWPLPGAPGYTGYGIQTIIDNALRDAYALIEGGIDGIIVENMWDIPYRAGSHIAPESIAAHAVVANTIRETIDIPMGINVVHNGGTALLGIALASRADFIRVCMFTGAGVWDAGSWDEGCAAELMRKRKELGAEHIKLFADVDKKHSVRFPGIDLTTHIEWTRFFGADALIISGTMTGNAPDLAKVQQAKQLAHNQPVLIGSGTTSANIGAFMEIADGVIVGSSTKEDGLCENPVSTKRVRELISAARIHAE